VPHTSWTFDLNTNEGWTASAQAAAVSGGILTVDLSGGSALTSMSGLDFYGVHSPAVEMFARTQSGSADVCLQFITLADWGVEHDKSSCVRVDPGDFRSYRLDFSADPALDGRSRDTASADVARPGDAGDRQDRRIQTVIRLEFGDPNHADGWTILSQLTPLQTRDGSLFSTSTGEDPYMVSPFVSIDAAAFSRIELRMKTSAGNDGDIFFVTEQDPDWSASKVQRFPLTSDGSYHVYTVDMSSAAEWSGRVQQIRLDPMPDAGDFAIDYVRILPP